MGDEKGAGVSHNNFVVSILRWRRYAADFLANYVPEGTAARIDWTRLKSEPTAMASEPNKQYAADCLFSAPFKDSNQDASFFVLLEHKSDVEKGLIPQLFKYVALKFNEFSANRTCEVAGRVPYPIPLVLYHGERPWKNPPTLRGSAYTAPELDDFIPEIRYILLDLAALNVDELKGGPIVRVFLEILKRVKDKTLKPSIDGIFREMTSFPWDATDCEAVRSIYFYLAETARNEGDALTLADIRNAANVIEDEEKRRQVKNFADELREEGFKLGFADGYERGAETTRGRVAASESARFAQRRFGDAISPELLARIEAVNHYPTLEKIRDAFCMSKDANEFIAAVESLLK